ncbi:NAD(P)-dependent dehydrogenase (short-subunit alcohol dehydrogenase family) [Novosphingobium chloroacetimidivorans]|uniref:NAD(P)-dependent dehydrogenase (Short-subunit alcohol dehydrogenase family) n=1 Tax=Novosphingobium chloroacetimidivorans TaxID=1428314 RepID=A0A7W7KA45_9SPHN|nr:SDR family NAD(P)-dependent oxidoreductase [Novosphingobium chloroacetimidivorans]MBB4858795.1 NAD(P)-dependent dehydrogenase (short-subunit alcohol dehydrogenase family) [Novosphingobium chloroacetimidivorans]
MRPLLRTSGRPVVVTNAGHGLGREIALMLAKRRSIVFGTAGSAQEVEDLRSASSGRVSLIACDMQQTQMVNAWAAGVSEAIGRSGLDLLINTAVHLPSGPLELLPLEEVRRGFEANVFGGLAVINAFLPALRMAQGRIVQISSSGRDEPPPCVGPSDASQAAVEAFSAAYRAELKPFGIDVVIASLCDLEATSTGPANDLTRLDDSMTAAQRKLYGKLLRVWMKKLSEGEARGDPATAAARVLDLAFQGQVPVKAAIDTRA